MAKLNEGNRSQARNAAEKGAQTPARKPAAREDSTNTTETAAAEVVAPDPIPLVVIAPNPKRKNTLAHGFFAKYGPAKTMTTFEAVREAGVRGKDVSWDRDRRHILMGDEAKNFPINGSRDEQAAYLTTLGVDAKRLIAWGYVDAPVPVVEAAEGAVAAADAAAKTKETENA